MTEQCDLLRSTGMLLQTGKLFLFSERSFESVPGHTVSAIYVNSHTALEGHRSTIRTSTNKEHSSLSGRVRVKEKVKVSPLKKFFSQLYDWETREHTLVSLWPSQVIFLVMVGTMETKVCLRKFSAFNNMAFHTFWSAPMG